MSKIDRIIKLLGSDAGFVFITSSMASGFSFLTSILMAHVLSANDYGIYGPCLNIFNYTVILGSTIQTSTTRIVAQLKVRSGVEGIKHFYWAALSVLLRLGFVVFIVLLALVFPVAGFLEVSPWLVLIVFSCAVLFGPLFMTLGTLQGLQSFRLFGVSLNVQTITRLALSLMLAILGLNIWGAIIALPLSMILTIGANIALVYWAIKHHHKIQIAQTDSAEEVNESELLKHPLRTFLTTSFFALFGMLSFALMTGIDLILVRHFFPTNDVAGQYTVVSTLGKAVLYFSAPIAFVALPKMSHAHELDQNVAPIFRRNFWLTLGASLVPVLILLVSSFFILKLFSKDYAAGDLPLLVPFYGVVMLLYGLVSLWIYFFISVGRNGYMFMVLGGAILEVILLFMFHDSLAEMIAMVGIPALVLCLLGEIELRLYQRNYKRTHSFPQPQSFNKELVATGLANIEEAK